MDGALAAAAAAFALVFLAELGDKTQLVVLLLAARGRPLRVLAGAAAAFALLTLLAVAVGDAVARLVPPRAVAAGAGLLFLLLGALLLRRTEEDEAPPAAVGPWGAFGLVAVAELGDKTQLALVALSARSGRPVATGIGGLLALLLATAFAALLGGWLGRRLPRRRLRVASAALFLLLGLVFLAGAAWPGLLPV